MSKLRISRYENNVVMDIESFRYIIDCMETQRVILSSVDQKNSKADKKCQEIIGDIISQCMNILNNDYNKNLVELTYRKAQFDE